MNNTATTVIEVPLSKTLIPYSSSNDVGKYGITKMLMLPETG